MSLPPMGVTIYGRPQGGTPGAPASLQLVVHHPGGGQVPYRVNLWEHGDQLAHDAVHNRDQTARGMLADWVDEHQEHLQSIPEQYRPYVGQLIRRGHRWPPEPPEPVGHETPPAQLSRSRLRFGRAPADEVVGIAGQQQAHGGGYDPNNQSDMILADKLADHGDPLETVVRRDLSYRTGDSQGASGLARNLDRHATELAGAGSPLGRPSFLFTRRLRNRSGAITLGRYGDDGKGNALAYYVHWGVPSPGGFYVAAMSPEETIHLLNEHGVPHTLKLPHRSTGAGPEQLSRSGVRRYGLLPREEVKAFGAQGVEGGQYDPANTADMVFADRLGDAGDPREAIVRRDLEHRGTDNQSFSQRHYARHRELAGGRPTAALGSSHPNYERVELPDGSSVSFNPYSPGTYNRYQNHEDQVPTSYEITWDSPNNVYYGAFSPEERDRILGGLREEVGDPEPPPQQLSRRPRRYSATDHGQFIDVINRNPRDMTSRGVYADYLEENEPNVDPKLLKTLRTHRGDVWVRHGPGGVSGGPTTIPWSTVRRANNTGQHGEEDKHFDTFDGTNLYGMYDGAHARHGQPHSGPGGVHFVTQSSDEEFPYTVHRLNDNGSITKGVSFHETPEEAHQFARRMSNDPPPPKPGPTTPPEPPPDTDEFGKPAPPPAPDPPAPPVRQPPKPISLADLMKPRRRSRVRRYSATEGDVNNLLSQLARNPDHQQPGSNLRLVAADALQERGRDREADVLRNHPHPVHVRSGQVRRNYPLPIVHQGTALDWHGGGGSALYQIGSTGNVTGQLAREALGELDDVRNNPHAGGQLAMPDVREPLDRLYDHLSGIERETADEQEQEPEHLSRTGRVRRYASYSEDLPPFPHPEFVPEGEGGDPPHLPPFGDDDRRLWVLNHEPLYHLWQGTMGPEVDRDQADPLEDGFIEAHRDEIDEHVRQQPGMENYPERMSRRRYTAYRAPAGGMISRGTHQPGGQFVPDLNGEFMRGARKVLGPVRNQEGAEPAPVPPETERPGRVTTAKWGEWRKRIKDRLTKYRYPNKVSPVTRTRRPIMFSATGSDANTLLAQLQQPEQNEHRWGLDNPLSGLRGVAADALDEQDREPEAALLREPKRHVLIHEGRVVPARFNVNPTETSYDAAAEWVRDNGDDTMTPEVHILSNRTRDHFRAEDMNDPEGYAKRIPRQHVRVVDADQTGADTHAHADVHLSALGGHLADLLENSVNNFGDTDWGDNDWRTFDRYLDALRNAQYEEPDPDHPLNQPRV